MIDREHTCSRIINGKLYTWEVQQLLSFITSQSLEVQQMEIDTYNTNVNPWFFEKESFTIKGIIMHFKSVNSANLDYPIILDPDGKILDGMHRFVKASMLGLKSISCVRIHFYPPAQIVSQ